ncbi:MAG: sugar ABC transporter permease [Caldilineaceae bacterium]|nr:sugar ABC transporter permease [Caldilineaceae bacterium]MCB9161334.1 sugar ABC transporter permease [Caldilineaceae bacterium]MCB9162497.1 sugar ABC transporter permease [Caldilineaceae bacterium]
MRSKAYPFYFAGGALLLYFVFFVLPSVMGFFYMFTDWNSYSSEVNFVGLENVKLIFSSNQHYLRYVKNTVVFTVATIALKTFFALGLALLLTKGIRRLAYIHRVLMYLPAVLPMLVISLVFKSILNPATGLLNTALRSVGLDFMAQAWLVDIHWAMPSVIAVDTWRGVGYIMVIMIAGLNAIPEEYYEAAAIDGANGWAAFRHITIPLLMPVLTVTTVLNLLYGLRVFDIVFVLTNGGPGRATDTVYTVIFDEFSKGRYGVATTLSTLLFFIMIVLGYFVIRIMHQEEAG